MGKSKRRRPVGKGRTAQREPRVEIRDPTEHAHIPGTITVHVLHDSGAALTAAVPLGEIDTAVKDGGAIARQFDRGEERDEARQWMLETLLDGGHARDPDVAAAIVCLAVWLASTAPEPHGSAARAALRSDHRLVVALTSHTVHGGKAINGRLMVFTPDKPLIEILQEFGLGPPPEFVTQRLAPH